jgi:hypothetical protein
MPIWPVPGPGTPGTREGVAPESENLSVHKVGKRPEQCFEVSDSKVRNP